jgi:large subunit ribosomal protein L10
MLTKKEKPKKVNELAELIRKYKCVGIIDLHTLPASQLQEIKQSLKDKAIIKVSKKVIIKRALEKVGLDKLAEKIQGQPALILSNESPFSLYAEIKKNKTMRTAKVGDIATSDIVVEAGATDLPPGPAISTLQKAGIKAKIEGGNITIIQTTTLCKKGEKITNDIVDVCNLLKLKPIEVMLNLVAAWEDGIIYDKSILAVDESEYEARIIEATREAFNLAVEANFVTTETAEFFIIKAYNEMRSLAKEAEIVTPETVEDIIIDAVVKAKILEDQTKG